MDEVDTNDQFELGTDVIRDDWIDIDTFQEETETEVFWDAQSCQEDEDICYHLDTEEEKFWDSLANSDDDIDTQVEVKSECVQIERLVNTQT